MCILLMHVIVRMESFIVVVYIGFNNNRYSIYDKALHSYAGLFWRYRWNID